MRIICTNGQYSIVRRACALVNAVFVRGELSAIADEFARIKRTAGPEIAIGDIEAAKKAFSSCESVMSRYTSDWGADLSENGFQKTFQTENVMAGIKDGHIIDTECNAEFVAIVCGEDAFHVMMGALDLYSRIIMGQFSRITEEFLWANSSDTAPFDTDGINDRLNRVRAIVYPDLAGMPYPAGFGISNRMNPEESKIAYEMHGMMLYAVQQMRIKKEKDSVYAAEPLHLTKEPLILVKY
jgi:hypothetical protein